MESNDDVELSGSFESPESSSIAGASYDASTETLIVRFRHGKGERRYRFSVPPNVWEEFLNATSKGTHFAHRIRPLFDGTKID